MEVKLDKRYPVAASVEQAWAVLRDVRAVAACMPGAAITEQIDDTHFKGTVKTKIGPAAMLFNGDIELLGLDAEARSLAMVGKGADKAGSSAQMNLSAHLEPGDSPGACVLCGQATILVAGKLAQFGSRLLVPVSDMMLQQFAATFGTTAAAVVIAPAAAIGTAPQAGGGGAAAVSDAPAADTTDTTAAAAAAAAPAAPVVVVPAQTEINALGFGWALFKRWLAGLFGRRTNA
jgi:carbon monoxide dehydrogenase subunit G